MEDLCRILAMGPIADRSEVAVSNSEKSHQATRGHDQATEDPNLPPLGRQAYQSLRKALRDGLIQQDRHYSGAELGEMLGVSRTPVREALKALEQDGVFEASRRRGYRLRTFSDAEIEEMLQLRLALEGLAVTRFVASAVDDDIAHLRAILNKQKRPDVGRRIFALDEEFHLAIAEATGLLRTRDILAGLRSAMAAISAGASVPEERTQQVVHEHQQIVDRLAQRDVEGSIRVLSDHIEASTEALVQSRREIARSKSLLMLVGKA